MPAAQVLPARLYAVLPRPTGYGGPEAGRNSMNLQLGQSAPRRAFGHDGLVPREGFLLHGAHRANNQFMIHMSSFTTDFNLVMDN